MAGKTGGGPLQRLMTSTSGRPNQAPAHTGLHNRLDISTKTYIYSAVSSMPPIPPILDTLVTLQHNSL